MKRVQRMWSATGRFTSRALWTAMAVGLVVISVTAVRAQSARTLSPAELFKEAQRLQQGTGNLEAAIETYRRVLAAKPDRALAARAQLAMADCFATLGKPEAAAAYEAVVRDYKDQTGPVKQARAWLDVRRAQASPPAGLQAERVWPGPQIDMEGRPTQDGKSFVYAEWSSSAVGLAIRDLKAGHTRRLTNDGKVVENALPSLDGKRIAYRLDEDPSSSIRVINADGSRMRVLLRDGHDNYLHAWSPDQKYIAAVHTNADRTRVIVLISSADGSIRQLKSTGATYPNVGGFSRDGRYLVYGLDKGAKDPTGGVFLLAVDGTHETPLVLASAQGATRFGGPMWSPDGRRVVFLSDRSGSPGLWSIEVTNGQPEAGSLKRLPVHAEGMQPSGFSDDGSFYYLTQDREVEAFSADFDPATNRVSKPMPVTDQGVGNNRDAVFSPDARHVAFVRRVGGVPRQIIVRPSDTGAERVVGTLATFAYGARTLEWFPDGRSLLVADALDQRKRFRRIDIATGESRTLFEGPWEISVGTLSSDGKSLFYSVKDFPEDVLRLMKRRLDASDETEIYRVKSDGTGLFNLVASPDGAWLAFNRNLGENGEARGLFILSTDGGTPIELYRTGAKDPWTREISWVTGSKYLLVVAGGGSSRQLYVIPWQGGGTLKPVGLKLPDLQSLAISADGRRIAWTAASSRQELWVIRNLLSEPVRSR